MELEIKKEPATEPVIATVSTEADQKDPNEDQIEWKAPESKEELDNMLKAAANRTYTKALKDLGVSSVKEFKETQAKLQEDLKLVESIKVEKDKALNSVIELEGKYNKLKTTSILNELNIEEDYREDLIKLASDKVNDETPIEAVLKEMIEGKYKYTVAQSNKIKMGVEKTDNKVDTSDKYAKSTTQQYPWLKGK